MKTKPTKARIQRVWIERKRNSETTGVIAKANIVSCAGVRQTLCSGGMWHDNEFEKEKRAWGDAHELGKLRSELASFGFGTRAIDYAMKNVERREIQ